MANNPIFIGFEWRQAFDFPDGFLEPGDNVRAEFRRYASDSNPIASIEVGAGVEIDENRVFLTLTEDQTAGMTTDTSNGLLGAGGVGLPFGKIITNFVVVRGETEIPIGVLVTAPVVQLPTRPLP